MPIFGVKIIRLEKLGGWLCLAAVMAPLRLPAMPLADTTSRYSLSGAIGLRTEDYEYDSGGSNYRRQKLRKEMDVSGSGHIWDPRFLRFNIGLNLREESTDSSQGDSDYSMLGYNVNTTWFGTRRNPLSMHASKSRSTVSDYAAPSYDMQTQTAGGRWGFESGLLGSIRLSADRIDNVATGGSVLRNETNEIAAVEAAKRTKGKSGISSDMNYGYRYNRSADSERGTAQRQHHVYASDRTTLSPTAYFNINATYYDRNDTWQDLSSASGIGQMDTRFFSSNSSLYLQASEKLRHSYAFNISRNEVNQSSTSTYSGRAGLNYEYNEHWRQHVSLEARHTEIKRDSPASISQQTAESGILYSSRLGDFMIHGGYTLALESQKDEVTSQGGSTTVRNSINVGYARNSNRLWQDNAEYRMSFQNGLRNTAEHNMRYSVSSMPGNDDNVNGAVELRSYVERDSAGERNSFSQRLNVSWTHRFHAMSSFVLSGGHARNQGDSTNAVINYDAFGNPIGTSFVTGNSESGRNYLQARLTAVAHGAGNIQYAVLFRREADNYTSGSDTHRSVVEGDANYTRGLWQLQLQYRLRETERSSGNLREQSIMLYGRRRFGGRF